MTNPKKIIVNCETGETTEVDLTAEEIAELEANQAAYEAQQAELQAIENAKAQAKASAEQKLAALGLTPDEVKALLG